MAPIRSPGTVAPRVETWIDIRNWEMPIGFSLSFASPARIVACPRKFKGALVDIYRKRCRTSRACPGVAWDHIPEKRSCTLIASSLRFFCHGSCRSRRLDWGQRAVLDSWRCLSEERPCILLAVLTLYDPLASFAPLKDTPKTRMQNPANVAGALLSTEPCGVRGSK